MSQMHDGASLVAGPPRQQRAASRNVPLIVGLGCVGLLVIACLFGGGVLTVVNAAMRSSDAYQLALAAAQRDPSVVAALGSPVQPGWYTKGQISVAGPSGQASLAIPISGPRGSATIGVRADKSAAGWTFSFLSVSVAGSSAPINLLAATHAP